MVVWTTKERYTQVITLGPPAYADKDEKDSSCKSFYTQYFVFLTLFVFKFKKTVYKPFCLSIPSKIPNQEHLLCTPIATNVAFIETVIKSYFSRIKFVAKT